MPDNTVSVQFIADTSQMSGAMAKLNNDLGAVAAGGGGLGKSEAAMADWRKEAGLSEVATITVGRKMVELGGHAYKTAADFKPATTEMRAASVAAKDVGESAENAGGGLRAFNAQARGLRFDVMLLAGAALALKVAWDAASESESSERRFSGLISDTQQATQVTRDLAAAAGSDNFKGSEYDDIAASLKVAGVQTQNLVGAMNLLGDSSRAANIPLKDVAKVVEDFQMGSGATWDDMKTITLATSGATQGLADQYRGLDLQLRQTARSMEAATEAQQRAHQLAQEHTSGVNSFAEKTGIAQSVFAKWKAQGMEGSVAGGAVGTQGISNTLTKEYAEGIKEIAKDNEISTQTVKAYIASGKIGYSDLISASQKYQGEQQQEVQYNEKLAKQAETIGGEDAKKVIFQQAIQVWETQAPAIHAREEAQKLTGEGMGQAAANAANNAAIAIGKPIIETAQQLLKVDNTAEPYSLGGAMRINTASQGAQADRAKAGTDFHYGPGNIVLPGAAPATKQWSIDDINSGKNLGQPQASANTKDPTLAEIAKDIGRLLRIHEEAFA